MDRKGYWPYDLRPCDGDRKNLENLEEKDNNVVYRAREKEKSRDFHSRNYQLPKFLC